MAKDHIVKSFDNELTQIDNGIAEMGGLCETQLADTIEALVRSDSDLAERVVIQDKRIDELEHEVNHHAVRLLALRQPMADDLRLAIAAMKTSSDLERIGDLAKNVAKRVAAVHEVARIASVGTIARMGRLVQAMIKTVLDAYIARDAEMAEDVRNQDAEVDQLHTSLFRELLTYMMEDPRQITACTHLLFIAKNVERMGDHATNIAESVIYLARGQSPAGERPKGDESSTTVVRA